MDRSCPRRNRHDGHHRQPEGRRDLPGAGEGKNDEGGSPWSAIGTGATSTANNAPVIGGGATVTITVAENATGSIGSAFTATDADGDTITWSVNGTGANSFNISGGQIKLASGVTLDYETKASYSITVIASDGTGSDSVAVTVTLTDVDEQPPAPPDPGSSPNNAPVIGGDASVTITVDENATGKIGGAFTATDGDGDTITWSVGGTGANSFDISDISGGQLSLASGSTLDYETQSSYSVTVTASDGTASDSVAVTVRVTDVREPPGRPAAPTVAANSTTSLTVTWGAPTNTGPPITRYYIHYCLDSTGCNQNSEWSSNPSTANTTATIADLREGETYQVRVRAKSNEGQSPWSAIGTGATSTAN